MKYCSLQVKLLRRIPFLRDKQSIIINSVICHIIQTIHQFHEYGNFMFLWKEISERYKEWMKLPSCNNTTIVLIFRSQSWSSRWDAGVSTKYRGATEQFKARAYTARPADDSAWFITHAAFYFNHINEAFNLAACFTSRRCVAYLSYVVDEDFSPVTHETLTPSTASFHSRTGCFPTNTTNPCPFAFIHLWIIIFLFSHPPAVSANNRSSFRPVYTCTLVAASFILRQAKHAPLR